MDIQEAINTRMGAWISIAIGRTMPPTLGYWVGRQLVNLISAFKGSDLVTSLRANQWVIHDEAIDRDEQYHKARMVLKHAARCYYDLYHSLADASAVTSLVPHTPTIREFIQFTRGDQGLFVVAPHLSNFDLVISALAIYGLEAKILTHGNTVGAYHVQNNIRASTGLEVTPLRDSSVFSDVVDHLKSGGIAATGVDRPVPHRKPEHQINFFGRPSALPVGHITLALAADVPITVVAAKMNPSGTYQFLHSGPIQLERHPNRKAEIIHNAEMILEVIEGFIKSAPHQWLMYHPVWPQALEDIP